MRNISLFSACTVLVLLGTFDPMSARAQHFAFDDGSPGEVLHMADEDFRTNGEISIDKAKISCQYMLAHFKGAFERTLEEEPNFKAKIDVEFVVENGPRIKSSRITHSSAPNTKFFKEVLHKVDNGSLFFPNPIGKKPAKVICGYTVHRVPAKLKFPEDEHYLVYPGR
jgi:hypothetical protein